MSGYVKLAAIGVIIGWLMAEMAVPVQVAMPILLAVGLIAGVYRAWQQREEIVKEAIAKAMRDFQAQEAHE